MKKEYDDMLDMPPPTSDRHPRMSRIARAAQFAPFAALCGFEALVVEEARVTEKRIILTDDEKLRIDSILSAALKEGTRISITLFVSDGRKSGGAYLTRAGVPKRIDAVRRLIILDEGEPISIDDIVDATV